MEGTRLVGLGFKNPEWLSLRESKGFVGLFNPKLN